MLNQKGQMEKLEQKEKKFLKEDSWYGKNKIWYMEENKKRSIPRSRETFINDTSEKTEFQGL